MTTKHLLPKIISSNKIVARVLGFQLKINNFGAKEASDDRRWKNFNLFAVKNRLYLFFNCLYTKVSLLPKKMGFPVFLNCTSTNCIEKVDCYTTK